MNFSKLETILIDECIGQLELDYASFHDIYQTVYGLHKTEPNEKEIRNIFNLVYLLLEYKEVEVLFGEDPEMELLDKNVDELMQFLDIVIDTEPYEYYQSKIWFGIKGFEPKPLTGKQE